MSAQRAPRSALITGITGQDGSFLAELLLERGYRVTGMIRDRTDSGIGLSEHLRGRIELAEGDLLDPESLRLLVATVRPDELYHLAAPSFVLDSWRLPADTFTTIVQATAVLLEAVRDQADQTRVFVAGSAAMFGSAPESPQREDTPCRPETPYATAKLAAHQLAGQLRAHAGVFVCSGILYNHESERRPELFVPRKITRAAAAIKIGLEHEVMLGDLTAVRDWSFAGDIMNGAWLTLQQDRPDDYIFASGAGHTVAELAEVAFGHLDLDARDHVCVDHTLVRAPEPTPRIGDPSRAHDRLGWRPALTFEQLIHRMVDADLQALSSDALN